DRQTAAVRHAPDPCRDPARPRHRRTAGADLPIDRLRLQGRRPRRAALQPAGGGLHLFAPYQSHGDGARKPDHGAGGRRGRRLLLLGARGADHGAVSADGAGAEHHRLHAALRRDSHAVHGGVPQVRLVVQIRGHRRRGRDPRRRGREHARDLLRGDHQSGRAHHRPAHGGARGERGGRAAHRGQHLGHAVPLPSVRAWGLHRRPFDHEVPDRQRHRHGRLRGRFGQVRLVGPCGQVPFADGARARLSRPALRRDVRPHGLHLSRDRGGAAGPWHDDEPAGRALHAARDRDAVPADGPACPERHDRGALAGGGSPRGRGHLCGARILAVLCPRRAALPQGRGGDLHGAAQVGVRGLRELREPAQAVQPCGEPGRLAQPRDPFGLHHTSAIDGGAAAEGRRGARHRAPVHRAGGHARPHRGPRSGAGRV
ncbi:MAG: O-acetylhomoserine sulfhydrylase / O-succinylhomoserine sulfhydrylase, partial [uncultured Rubellimicrobium sp.]